ncbi:uncharacterized protein LOC135346395 [Halichondria panicea]|uniref:uncharacterized protein LOC135346395 n=1 Tax=Halichondria panicea TaxID=6063 RepID=UPI00312BA67B
MAAFRLLSKDETFDPGVNLDSCGEDSDSDNLNNDKLPSFGKGADSLDAVYNDLSCQCSGTKCLCDDHTLSCSHGGPDADPGPTKGCQCKRLQPQHQKRCKGEGATRLYNTNDDTFECGNAHSNLCKWCAQKCPYCPICGPQAARR